MLYSPNNIFLRNAQKNIYLLFSLAKISLLDMYFKIIKQDKPTYCMKLEP